MNRLTSRFNTRFVAYLVATLLLIVAVVLVIGKVSHADSAQPVQRGRLITIYDRGDQKVILSDAATVGDALKQANVTLAKEDTVEPAASEKLVASEYKINIYRARPVIVIDGNVREKIMTPYQTPSQIAASAGITLYPEDIATIDRVDNLSEGAGLQLTINRATPVNFLLYGKQTTIRTHAKTVSDLLKEKGINLTANDTLSVPLSQAITSGMNVELWRNGKQTVNVDEDVAFDTQQIRDADQPIGYKVVQTPGTLGKKTTTYEVDMKNGIEVSRVAIQSVIIKNPISEIDVIGAKYTYTTPTQNESIAWNYLIAQGFSRAQTAGIMGNLQQEHHFDTSGDGIVQWSGSRKALLLSKLDPYSIYTQLDFLMGELNGGYSFAKNAILATNSVDAATITFQNEYEKCGNCMQSTRIQYAYSILASF